MTDRRRAWRCLVIALAGCGEDGGPVAPDAMVDLGPGADDIDFAVLDDLPSGEWLLANDWGPTPNLAFVLPVGDLAAPPRYLFSVNRVWSMGAAADGSAIYFSAWDAEQEAHFGVTIGDAIQNSFVYRPATEELRALAWGNINDECQEPSPDGAHLFLCRRYDFTPEGVFDGWRIGRLTVADGSFEFLRPDAPGGPFELSPQAIPGTELVLFEERARPPMTGNTIRTRELGTGVEVVVRSDAGRPALAPDGHTVLFADRTDRSKLKTFDLDAPATAAVAVSPTESVGDAAWSSDGDTIVYTVFDSALSCDHLEQVSFDGAAWSAPLRVRDCAQTAEFITDLVWLVVP